MTLGETITYRMTTEPLAFSEKTAFALFSVAFVQYCRSTLQLYVNGFAFSIASLSLKSKEFASIK